MISGGDSFEETVAQLRQQTHIAAEHAQDWQVAVKAGDFVVIFEPEAMVYSEILPDPPEYANDDRRFWRFSRGFSRFEPTGEYGDIHVGAFTGVLTAEQFERARSLGWPKDQQTFLGQVVKGDPKYQRVERRGI